MFSLIRRRFTYANVAMTLALVFAMTGGAYAAKHYLITSTKQISPKVLKQLKGARGPQGVPGLAGSQGSAGPAGKDGLNGKNGTNGTNGTSVTSSAEPAGANCKAGGAKFVSGSGTTYACNGENGKTGFTETLPSGKTETGDFALLAEAKGEYSEGKVATAISFDIPLAAPLGQSQVHFIHSNGMEVVPKGTAETEEVQPTKCLGSAQSPTAEPGNLCIYANSGGEVNSIKSAGMYSFPAVCALDAFPEEYCQYGVGADATGFGLFTEAKAAGLVDVSGTWAVTAE